MEIYANDKLFQMRIIPIYNKKYKLFSFNLFTIDIDDEGISIILFNISIYYGE